MESRVMFFHQITFTDKEYLLIQRCLGRAAGIDNLRIAPEEAAELNKAMTANRLAHVKDQLRAAEVAAEKAAGLGKLIEVGNAQDNS